MHFIIAGDQVPRDINLIFLSFIGYTLNFMRAEKQNRYAICNVSYSSI